MKKLTLITMILSVLAIANAQVDEDYNPYSFEVKKASQEQIRIQGRQEFLAKKCEPEQLQKWKDFYDTTKIVQYLYTINQYCNCPEVIDYAINLINTSPDKEARKIAILMLSYRRYYNAIPLLLSHVKKEITPDEKIEIAMALASLDRKEEALEILDCNCYTIDEMHHDCVYTYITFFDKPTAMKYFEHCFNKPEMQLQAACWLAMCGIYDKTFPLFVEFLENNTTYERETVYSFCGLAAIGSEEAIEIIKKYVKYDETVHGRLISGTAASILKDLKGRRGK